MCTNRWIDKEDVVHIHNRILLSRKKEQNKAICSNVEKSKDYYTKWSKPEREKQIPHDIAFI